MPDRIYIAGPMRGYPGDNELAFSHAARQLRACGWAVCSPAELCDTVHGGVRDLPALTYLRTDVEHLLDCRAIALLPGWEYSTGASCEAAIAVTFGHQFYDAVAGHAIVRPTVTIQPKGYDAPPRLSLDALSWLATLWANETFTKATPESKAAHLVREAKELAAAPEDLEELADCFMLLGQLRNLANAGDELDAHAEGCFSVRERLFFRNLSGGSRSHLDAFLESVEKLRDRPRDPHAIWIAFTCLFRLVEPRQLAAGVAAKLTKNMGRTWGEPDADGVVEHIAEAE